MTLQNEASNKSYIVPIVAALGPGGLAYLISHALAKSIVTALLTGLLGLATTTIKRVTWRKVRESLRSKPRIQVIALRRSDLPPNYFDDKYEKKAVWILASALQNVLRELADPSNTPRLISLLRNGGGLQLWFLDPRCEMASQRARAEVDINFWQLMKNSMEHVKTIHSAIEREDVAQLQGTFEIAVTSDQIYETMYRELDQNDRVVAYWGPYSAHMSGFKLPLYSTSDPRIVARIESEFAGLGARMNAQNVLLKVSRGQLHHNRPVIASICAHVTDKLRKTTEPARQR